MSEILNACQRRMWSYPDELEVLADLGGAGAGRTNGAFALAYRYLTRFPRARGLFVRQIFAALRPAFEEAVTMAYRMGVPVKPNKTELTVTLNNGSVLEFAPLEDMSYFRSRYLGASFSFITIDEWSTWTDPNLPLMLLSRLRHGTYPCRFICLSNPGPSGTIIHRQLMRGRKLGVPFVSDWLGGKETVVLSSTARDNEFLDLDAYIKNLRAASPSEAHFQRMFNGSFQAVESSLHILAPVHEVRWPRFDPAAFPDWKFLVSYDHGTIAPWAAVWLARAQRDAIGPDGTTYVGGSYVAFYESHNATEESAYTKASSTASIVDIAEQLKADAEVLNFKRVPVVYGDDQICAETGQATVVAEFRRHGIRMAAAGKGKIRDGIQRINDLLRGADAAQMTALGKLLFGAKAENSRGSDPGLFLVRRDVPYLWMALENASSDPRDMDSLNPRFAQKHIHDALRYGLGAKALGIRTEVIQGAL